MPSPLDILRKYWGYDSFRPLQEEIISSALSGRDTLAILPTGGGKSVCFQVPAMLRDGLALVVTPLVALMKDQVASLREKGIGAIAVHAGMNRREVDLALNNAAYGDCKFLYVSPERLSTFLFKSYLSVLRVSFLVVDEAHCISQWGYDFRPDYLQIAEVRKCISAPVIALTASATPRVREDILSRLGCKEQNVISGGFRRPNLSYVVRKTTDKEGLLLSILGAVPGTGIVYVRNRKRAEEIASLLNGNGISAEYFHAGLHHASRAARQERWKSGETRVMVCTNAFGMGIDKPDVRTVVHMDLPDSLEAYYQEAGRAGRDLGPSYVVLLWNGNDTGRVRRLCKLSFPTLEYIEDIYQKVHMFLGITYDQGKGWESKFDMDAFCAQFEIRQKTPVYYAIKYLERLGHWTLTEDVDIDTRVKIKVDRGELYDIEFPDRRMARLLEDLMRRLPGIFSYAVPVDEEFFSSLLGVEVSVYRQLLYQLSVLKVISYIPSGHDSILSIHHSRWTRGNLSLSPQSYASLQRISEERVEAMCEYVETEGRCREEMILEYFGEENPAPCLHCDVCRDRAKKQGRTP